MVFTIKFLEFPVSFPPSNSVRYDYGLDVTHSMDYM